MVNNLNVTITDGVAQLMMNRPENGNAQSWDLLDEIDAAMTDAAANSAVKVIVIGGIGKHFSVGHDLGSPDQVARMAKRDQDPSTDRYGDGRRYMLEYTARWRNNPKPTVAMVHGKCIWGGWMIAASMDLVFAADDALFLPTLLQYFSVSWDLGARKAKELLFESRFMPAAEALDRGFVNRIYPAADLHAETLKYALRVAQNSAATLRHTKQSINNMLDMQGFSAAMNAGYHDSLVWQEDERAVLAKGREGKQQVGVALALRWLKEDNPRPTD